MTAPAPLQRFPLYDDCLLDAARNDADRLLVVSGYASPAFASTHMRELVKYAGVRPNFSLQLLVGMASRHGILHRDHQLYQRLTQYNDLQFEARYNIDPNRPVHAKVYVWLKNGSPVDAWTGSANYTANGFGRSNRPLEEVLTRVDHDSAYDYTLNLFEQGLDVNDPAIGSNSIFVNHHPRTAPTHLKALPNSTSPSAPSPTDRVVLSLLDEQTQETHNAGGGINWGQPTPGRTRPSLDEAYLHVPAKIQRREFFPPRGTHFPIETDDGELMIFARLSGTHGKQITTPHNNAELGLYLRRRLGLRPGAFVLRKHLDHYGRTDVTLWVDKNGRYHLDFSV